MQVLRSPQRPRQMLSSARMEPDGRRPKILVVDDNEQNRALAEATLLGEDCYDVILAKNGEEALAAFDRERPDCVLLDVRMPGMDGFAVCERIRQRPGGPECPVLFLTALRDVDTFDSALRAGGDDFLTKPVRPTELLLRIQTALRLGRLGRELQDHLHLVRKQRDDLMRLQLQSERLMSFVVHDLKNPVNTIGLAAQGLLRDPSLSDRARRSAENIRGASHHLLRLILNLLDLNKGDEGQLQLHPTEVDLRALTEAVLAEVQLRAQADEIRLLSAIDLDPPTVRADPDLLRRVLENLVDNALRYAPEGSAVTIQAARVGAAVEIRVIDEGPGVAPDLREKIFERYAQLEAGREAASRSGRGLGLSFCRLAVEAHGGRIWLAAEGPGSSFCVRLPDER